MIVEAQPILSQGLALALSGVDDICVVGSAVSASSAEEFAAQLHPDVLVVDAANASSDMREHLRSRGHVPAMVLLSTGDGRDREHAEDLGAVAVVPREASLQDLADAIRHANASRSTPEDAAHQEVQTFTRPVRSAPRTSGLSQLSAREIEVLQLLVQGLSHRAIADELHLAVNTVRTHTRNIQLKLNVHSNLEAVSFALGRMSPSN